MTLGDKLGLAFVAAQIFEKIELAYDRRAQRRRLDANDEKDRKIRELEERLSRLEARAASDSE